MELGFEVEFVKRGWVFGPRELREGKLGRSENLESSRKTSRHLTRSLDKICPAPVWVPWNSSPGPLASPEVME